MAFLNALGGRPGRARDNGMARTARSRRDVFEQLSSVSI